MGGTAPTSGIGSTPIYVDFDHSLLRTSLTLESLLGAVKRSPLVLFAIPWWLLRGANQLRSRLERFHGIDAGSLPVRSELVEYLKAQKETGRRTVFVTTAAREVASTVDRHSGLAAEVLCVPPEARTADARARLISGHAAGPFTYAGSSASDLPVWRAANAAILVGTGRATASRVADCVPVERDFPVIRPSLRAYLKAARVYQWLKNVLIFLPLLTASLLTDAEALASAVRAFVAFSLCASAIYILNDLFDLPSDRGHPRKRNRPFASGVIPVSHGLVMAPILLATGLLVAANGGIGLLIVTALYVVITTFYSLFLKTFVLADVITLAGLYTIRVVAGAVAIDVTASFWLLAFSMSLFTSLALIKRCAELLMLGSLKRSRSSGRDYRVEDLPVLQSMGVASGFSAVLVLALFINAEDTAASYAHPQLLWLLCCSALYWVTRMWIKTARQEMHDDPLLYAARDWNSLAVLAGSVIIVLFARG
jgi:4-hydroxybenzoate polyprenyltransferase